jgi:hypothetical protein
MYAYVPCMHNIVSPIFDLHVKGNHINKLRIELDV